MKIRNLLATLLQCKASDSDLLPGKIVRDLDDIWFEIVVRCLTCLIAFLVFQVVEEVSEERKNTDEKVKQRLRSVDFRGFGFHRLAF